MRVSCRHWSAKIGVVFFYSRKEDKDGENKNRSRQSDMITERIEKYEKRMSYDKGKLNN